jgi:hypothetical protein
MAASLQDRLDLTDRLRSQQHIATHRANLGRHTVNDHDLVLVAEDVYDVSVLVLARTTLD